MKRPLIAVVNQDTLFLELLEDLLSEEGYATFIVKEGDKAYQTIKKQVPDLVVLDIRLNNPEDGFKVIDLLRLDPATAHIPVIVCTTATHIIRESEQRLREKQCDILLKPFNIDDLLVKLANIIGPAR